MKYIKINLKNKKTIRVNLELLIKGNDRRSANYMLSVKGESTDVKEFCKVARKGGYFHILSRDDFNERQWLSLDKDDLYQVVTTKEGNLSHAIIYNVTRLNEYVINQNNEPLVDVLTKHLIEKANLPVTKEIVSQLIDKTEDEQWYGNVHKHEWFSPLQTIGESAALGKVEAYYVDAEMFNRIMIANSDILASDKRDTFDWESIQTIEDYILTFAESLSNRIQENVDFLYTEEVPVNEIIFKGDKKPFNGQVPLIASCIEILKQKKEKFAYLGAEQGVGKTLCGVKTAIGYFNEVKKANPCTFILCPATTIEQWREEILECTPDKKQVDIIEIEDTASFINLYEKTNLKFNKPTYILCSKETFKLSYDMAPVYKKKTADYTFNRLIDKKASTLKEVTERVDALTCIDCGKPLYEERATGETIFFAENDFKHKNNSNSKCPHCNSSLWTAVYKKKKKVSLIEYIKARKVSFDLVLIDEAHEGGSNPGSLIGQATSTILRKLGKNKALLLSGTHNNGYASSLYTILFALMPRALKKDNVLSLQHFVEKYGTLETSIPLSKAETDRGGNLVTKKGDFIEAEGINPLVFTKFLSKNFVSAELTDIAENLPPLIEKYVRIEPNDELLQKENFLHQELKSAKVARTMAPSILRHFSNNPFSWAEIPVKEGEEIIQPLCLNETTLLNKEVELLNIIKKERELGRKVMIYVEFNDGGGKYMSGDTIPERLKKILAKNDIDVFELTTKTCPRKKRKETLEKASKQYDVFMCNRTLVNVGINLQFIPTYINYIPSFMVNQIEQANRRGLRANSVLEAHVYHLYYSNVYEERAIKKYQKKKAESAAIQGKFGVQLEDDSLRTASKVANEVNAQLGNENKNISELKFITKPMNVIALEDYKEQHNIITKKSVAKETIPTLFADETNFIIQEPMIMNNSKSEVIEDKKPFVQEKVQDTIVQFVTYKEVKGNSKKKSKKVSFEEDQLCLFASF